MKVAALLMGWIVPRMRTVGVLVVSALVAACTAGLTVALTASAASSPDARDSARITGLRSELGERR